MKKWRLIVAFLIVFISGAVAGAGTLFGVSRHLLRFPPQPAEITEKIVKEFRTELSLTPQQMQSIRLIVARTADSIARIHQSSIEGIRAEFRDSDADIIALLDAAQREKFEKFRMKRAALPPFGPPNHESAK